MRRFTVGKVFALGRSVPFWVMLLLVGVFVFVSSDPPIVLFGLFVVYGSVRVGHYVVAMAAGPRTDALAPRGAGRARHADAPTFTAPHTYQLPESEGQGSEADQRSPSVGNVKGSDKP